MGVLYEIFLGRLVLSYPKIVFFPLDLWEATLLRRIISIRWLNFTVFNFVGDRWIEFLQVPFERSWAIEGENKGNGREREACAYWTPKVNKKHPNKDIKKYAKWISNILVDFC